ncbi:MAG: M20/M25/M40 family metallo-hydrolase, partial [Myxococcota bacterium]
LVASRNEGAGLPCVLVYGHGDTVAGMEQSWSEGLHPFRLTRRGKRLYGRGTADNKSQHWINLTALRLVLEEKGALGARTA